MAGIKEQFQKLTPLKALFVGGGLMAVYFLMFYDKGAAQMQQMATVQAELSEKKSRLDEVNKAMANKVTFERQAATLTKELEQLLKYLPVQLDMNQIQADLTNILQATNNKVLSMKNTNVSARFPGYHEEGLDLQISGRFHDIMKFLSDVTKMDRLVDFKSMDFEVEGASNANSMLKFRTVVSIFSPDSDSKKGDTK